ncbi:MAG: MFS transporter [Actinomycetota bacterium]|nr:MFS transporter [Actinomycetota bacterium]
MRTPSTTERLNKERLTTGRVLLLAISCGVAVASLYYPQPLLRSIAASLHTGSTTAGLVVTAAQLGYAMGLALLVPLGDILARRRVVPALLAVDAVALAASAAATNTATLIVLALLVGAGSTAAQILVPLAASLADDTSRGRVVGMVMTGLLLGILFAWTVGGAVAALTSWRVVYLLAAVLVAVVAITLARGLPAETARPPLSYRALLGSTVMLLRREPVLRRRGLLGALSFAAFSLYLTTAAFLLAGTHYHYSESAIGLFGLIGVVGAACAPLAGRIADRGRTAPATCAAAAAIGASFVLLYFGARSLPALIAGVVVLNGGVQIMSVLNLSVIYALAGEARSRVNANYMVMYFVGGAAGSAAGSVLYAAAGWAGVCVFGAALGLTAVVVCAYDQQ